jgi:signal transduction histidine kinase
VRRRLERQSSVFAAMLALAFLVDAWRLYPSREFDTILGRMPLQIAVCVAAFVALRWAPLGRSRPMVIGIPTYGAAAYLGGGILGDLGGFDGPFFYAVYIMPTFVMMIPCRLGDRILTTGVIVGAFLVAFFGPHPEHLDHPFAHIGFMYLAVVSAVDVYFGHQSVGVLEQRFDIAQALDRRSRALAEDNGQLEERVRRQTGSVRSLIDRLETVRHRERTDIARDLHDGMGQLVVGARMELGLIERALDVGDGLSTENLGYLYGLVDRLDRSVREMVRDLRDPSAVGSLGVALDALVRSYQDVPGLHVALVLDLDEEPGDSIREVLVRVSREALTNAVRHARAGRVELRVEGGAAEVSLVVEDDGIGLDGEQLAHASKGADRESFGVVGMRERVEAVGGTFGIETIDRASRLDGSPLSPGTRVWARLPSVHPRRPSAAPDIGAK